MILYEHIYIFVQQQLLGLIFVPPKRTLLIIVIKTLNLISTTTTRTKPKKNHYFRLYIYSIWRVVFFVHFSCSFVIASRYITHSVWLAGAYDDDEISLGRFCVLFVVVGSSNSALNLQKTTTTATNTLYLFHHHHHR
jgi:hypothetical protein